MHGRPGLPGQLSKNRETMKICECAPLTPAFLVAQRERELIWERTCLGLAAAKTKGVKLGTSNPEKTVAAMVTANKSAKVFPVIEEIKSAGV